MNTGENKLSTEMMDQLYESYKLHLKEDYEKFVEDRKKTIYVSDRGCPDIEDILKLAKGTLITDNHNRRLVDPSIFKIHGKTLNVWDESYPVMFPEDEKMMRGMSDEIREKFQEYVSENLNKPRPMSGVTIQRVMSSKYFLKNDSIPDSVREEAERKALLYGDCYIAYYPARDFVILTGTTKNFKVQQTCDKLEALYDFYQELQKSYELKLQKTLGTPPSTKFELKSVIHMRWHKPALSNLKARDFRYGKMWQDQELINYATGDVSHIDMMVLDSLATFGPDINSGYDLSTPNLNDIDKKKLERVIKRRKKR